MNSAKDDMYMLWDNVALAIVEPPPEVERFLHVTESSIEMVWEDGARYPKRKIVRRRKPIFNVLSEEGPRVIQTYQGLWRDVMERARKAGRNPVLHDKRMGLPAPRLDRMQGFRFSQRELLTKFLLEQTSGLLGAPTRWGKCFGIDTPVLMHDGTVKPVQGVKEGDLVMGPDSLPRKATGCISGEDDMYEIVPNYHGMPWVCNSEHVLHLVRTNDGTGLAGTTVDITVREYLLKSRTFKHVHKMYRSPVDFPGTELPVDPYIYGVWLGDGTVGALEITNSDKEAWSAMASWSSKVGLVQSDSVSPAGKATTRRRVMNKGRGSTKPGGNWFRQWFRAHGKEDGIDPAYLTAGRSDRLELLAGLLDTDGYVNGGVNYEIITKHAKMADGIVFLCGSLGFGVVSRPCRKSCQGGFTGNYFRIHIRGKVRDVPTKVPHKTIKADKVDKFDSLRFGFKIVPKGRGTYHGFSLEDKDGLFLLGDFTVVHNTTLLANTVKAYPGVCTVVTVPGIDLVRQLHAAVAAANPDREVVLLGAGSRKKLPSQDVTVASIDSLHKCDSGRVGLLLIDEPHACVTDSRMNKILRFEKARVLGFGATLSGRFDGRDKLITGLIGPVLAERTYLEAVDEGAICPIAVILLKLVVDDALVIHTRDAAYNRLLFRHKGMAKMVARLCREVIPEEWQALLFIKNEVQALGYLKEIGEEGTIAMAKRMTDKERKVLMARMHSGEVRRCLATDIYAQGVTFPDLRVLVNLAGGGDNTTAIQKPGRLAEIRPGKPCGIVVDMLFEYEPGNGKELSEVDGAVHAWKQVVSDSRNRRKAYARKGYIIREVSNLDELKGAFGEFADGTAEELGKWKTT